MIHKPCNAFVHCTTGAVTAQRDIGRAVNLFPISIASYVFFPNRYRNHGPNRNLTLGPNPSPNPDPNYKPNPNPTINPLFTSFYFLRNGYTG
jgi:hypothetical protein